MGGRKTNAMSDCRVCHRRVPSAIKVKYDAWQIEGSNKENVEENKMESVRVSRSTFSKQN